MASLKDLRAAAAATKICIATLPGFTPPTQARTRHKTDMIVASAAFLLQSKDFAKISMQDVAINADCSVTSIYARFRNKEALLPAVHLIVLQHYRSILSKRFSPEIFAGSTLMDFAAVFIEIQESYFSENKNFIRAAMISNGEYIHEQTNGIYKDYASRLNAVVPMLLSRAPESTIEGVGLAIRIIVALFRDSALGGAQARLPEKTVLARLFATIIEEDLNRG